MSKDNSIYRISLFVIFSIIISFLIVSCSRNNNKEVVPLMRVEGFEPFITTQIFCFEHPQDSLILTDVKLPDVNFSLSLRVFHSQMNQYLYFLYKNKYINEEKFLERFRAKNIDTTKLTDKLVDEAVVMAIGKLDDKIIVYIDTNNDNNLLDETPVNYEIFNNPASEKEAMKEIEPVKVEVENYDGVTIIKRSIPLFINPYKGSLQIDSEQIFLACAIYEHHEGKFSPGDGNYQILINNGNLTTTHTAYNTEVLLLDDTGKNEINIQNEISYKIGEVINLNYRDYSIDSIDFLGENIFFTFISENKNPVGLKTGFQAPDIKGFDINNRYFDLDTLENNYVIIDFWGTWCGPCKEEIPYLKKLHNDYRNKVKIVSIALDENKEKVKEFIKENEMNWNHLFVPFNDTTKNNPVVKYKINKYPSTYLIGQSGKIMDKDLRGEELIRKIKSL